MKVTDFIACEDARTEVGNKVSLMGVYADEMYVGPTPGFQSGPNAATAMAFRIAVHIGIALEPGDPMPDKLELKFDYQQATVATVNGSLTILDRSRPIVATIQTLTLALVGPGVLRIELSVMHKGNPAMEKTIKTIRVSTESPP